MVKSAVENRLETKNHVLSITNRAIGAVNSVTTPYAGAISDVGAGTDQHQRIGNQITLSSIKYDFFFSASGAQVGADMYNNLRMIVYVSRDSSSLITNLTYNDPVESDDFYVIRDFFIPLGNGYPGSATVRRQGWIKFPRGKKVTFNGPAANAVSKNRVCVYCVSDSQAAPDPYVNGYFRAYFKDA